MDTVLSCLPNKQLQLLMYNGALSFFLSNIYPFEIPSLFSREQIKTSTLLGVGQEEASLSGYSIASQQVLK